MTRTTLWTALSLAAAATALACSDLLPPTRLISYDWRLIVPYDSAGQTYVDTLSFHWPRTSIPVRIWVEDQFDLPTRVQEGIALWRPIFIYGEWNAVLVNDSNQADVIVRAIQPPPTGFSRAARVHAMARSCFGATDVDTGATRFQLQIPIHSYIFPSLPNAPDILQCMRIVAAHELGHSLGILEESPDSLDLMFSNPTVDYLSGNDTAAAINAYHYPAAMVPVWR
ncbi:MAG TPA: hypothetical protein VMG41_17440 [Gemmatimonadales bacterium]|nr:hypothetical protein [Gemmatimonadales bacterium]